MSKISDAIRECEAFTEVVVYRLANGPPESIEQALIVANAFIKATAEALSKLRRDPFGVAWKVFFSGGWDPFEDVRPLADSFLNQWSKEKA